VHTRACMYPSWGKQLWVHTGLQAALHMHQAQAHTAAVTAIPKTPPECTAHTAHT